ncbi:ABC transporter substrate-binding protein [Pseudoroseomonas wenyumeiae]|uniref:ABC transporter substrate-binding protein n=1 Tax=Teichococcus wenyumeiae TaxID=2478470 RepID=A0A3A9JA23_9PROT|nr:ABC transporter substrate-binding protein [Pseudoroseomonas wenyumeiae]RKK04107.1 ABC transporter substrate-binding protein [Pseudoroseomonas wenyumeiae]RMI19659.1 ABC transporter substrate-binding protein [Pseudoroseomonas wenyumeiae]
MKRRTLLGAAAGATTAGLLPHLSRPALAQGNARVLRFVPEGNLANPDPIWTTTTIARNHGAMIWDTLYGLDDHFEPQPQMVAGHELSDDRLTWRFTLRDGLMFHDGEKVRAIDCITSIQRWARRRPLGQTLLARAEEMKALDDNRFEIRLNKPYSLMTRAFADSCFIMPERIAKTDSFQQIGEYVGSGPFRFLRDEWVAGSKAIYARFDKYVPRQEKPSFLAGGKVAHFDRVEWIVMPDSATAAGALQNGEVDWLQRPDFDLLGMLRGMRNVKVAVNDKVGVLAMMALNHIQPPFDNPKLLRAILSAVNQEDFMAAAVGAEPELFHVPAGVFTPGLPMSSDAGMEVLTRPRDIAKARQLVQESGYKGEKVLLMSPSDYPVQAAHAQVAAALFKELGLNVEFASMDWGTLVQRRSSKELPDKGGWTAFTTTYEGLTVADPSSNVPLRGNGAQAWFGWPTSPRLEALREEWLDAPDTAEQKRIAAEMQRIAFEEVPFIPLGQLYYPTAHRTELRDIVPASFPIFWNVRRA